MANSDRTCVARRIIGYEKLPSQERFHGLRTRFKGFSGPVGSGKSAALCQEALDLAFRNNGRTGLIGAPTYNMLRDSTLMSLEAALRKDNVDYELNRSNLTLTIKECKSPILLRSMDDPQRLRGTNLAWFGIDELTYCSEQAWLQLEARLRDPAADKLCGFGVWTPKGFDWVYRRFIADKVKGYGVVQAEPFENVHLLDATPDYYERLKASYDEASYRQEVLGGYLNLQADQVYYAFDRDKNVGDYGVDGRTPLLWSWDFNVNPMASVISQRHSDVIYVVDEIFLASSSTPEVVGEFLRRYGGHRAGLEVYGDSSGNSRHTVNGETDYKIIREMLERESALGAKVHQSKSNPSVRERVNLVNARLKSYDGGRKLFIDGHCKKLIRDLEQVCYKPDSGAIDKNGNPELTHASDALGYLLWKELQAGPAPGEKGQRLF